MVFNMVHSAFVERNIFKIKSGVKVTECCVILLAILVNYLYTNILPCVHIIVQSIFSFQLWKNPAVGEAAKNMIPLKR